MPIFESTEYIVLRADAVPADERPRGLETMGAEPAPQAGIKVATERFDNDRQASEVLEDPATITIARNMPVSLIEPLEGPVAALGVAWGIEAVGAPSDARGERVKVAVLDTGLMKDWATSDAFKHFVVTEKNFANFTDESPHDEHGHGTHCAGTIFGNDVNNQRIGIARAATPLIGKVLGSNGGTTAALFRALKWAQEEGADVISMSLGFDYPGMVKRNVDRGVPVDLASSIALEAYRANLRALDALLQMFEQSVQANRRSRPLIVAAAGNESRKVNGAAVRIAPALPSASHGVISVGALQQMPGGFGIADFSNGTPWISAPGVGIDSVGLDGNLRSMSGTSMACPHVAAVAALWWEQQRDLNGANNLELADDVKGLMKQNAMRQGLASSAEAGAGLVRAP